MFTTRPEILGTFGVVTSTHWLGSAAGMAMLERGGNAFDAASPPAFVLQVVEPHLNGPGGDVPIDLPFGARPAGPRCSAARAPAPARRDDRALPDRGAATSCPARACSPPSSPAPSTPGCCCCATTARCALRDVLEPAIHYAEHGHPLLPRVADTIAGLQRFLPGRMADLGRACACRADRRPRPRQLFRNPALAETWQRDPRRGRGRRRRPRGRRSRRRGTRSTAASSPRRSTGFCRTTEVMDASGRRHRGVLTGDDMAGWSAHYEAPLDLDYHDWTRRQDRPLGPGAGLPADAGAAEGLRPRRDGPGRRRLRPYRDRGDEARLRRPRGLLRRSGLRRRAGRDAAVRRLRRRAPRADRRHRLAATCGRAACPGFEAQVERRSAWRSTALSAAPTGRGRGEPTMADMLAARARRHRPHRRRRPLRATWSRRRRRAAGCNPRPAIPELGFALNTPRADVLARAGPAGEPRARQAAAHHADAVAGARATAGRRSPSARRAATSRTSGSSLFFLRHVHHGLNLQEAIDTPLFHTTHFPSSFYPREAQPGHLLAEESFGPEVLAELRRRGHDLEIAPAWTVGRLIAAARDPDGLLRAAATPRLMQAYAAGR